MFTKKLKQNVRKLIKKPQRIVTLIVLFLLLIEVIRFGINKPETALADVYLGFDEGYGTSSAVNDRNGAIAAGSVTNATWKQEEFCKYGKCLYFDGNGDYISFADDRDLDFRGTSTFTITGWFRHPIISTNPDYLIAKHSAGSTGGYKVYMDSDGDLVFGVDDDGTWDTTDIIGDDQNKNYDDNLWHFFSAVKNGTTGIYLYVDGVLIDQDTSLSETGSLANTSSFYVGIDSNGSSNSWEGFIDEVKVSRTAKSNIEIATEYLGTTTSTSGDGPVGYWKMDESSLGTPDCTTDVVFDSSGNANHGASCPSSTGPTGGVTGKFGNGINFDGSDDYILVQDASNLDVTTNFTISAWINADSLASGDYYIVSKDGVGSDTTDAYGFFAQAGGRICYETNNRGGNVCSVSNAITTGNWVHVAVAFDDANTGGGKAMLYVNGVKQEYINSNTTQAPIALATNFLIGRRGNSGSLFDGKLDDLRIYNYTRSQTQILEDMVANPPTGVSASFGSSNSYLTNGLVGYWKMDEASWTADCSTYTINDYSGNGNNGRSCPNSTGPTGGSNGKFGNGGNFDGNDDYLQIASSDSLGSLQSNLSISAWVKRKTTNSDDVIFAHNSDTSNEGHYLLYLNSGGSTSFRVGRYDTGYNIGSVGGITDTTNWHNLTMTFDGTKLTAYLDGSVVGTTTSGTYTPSNAVSYIGSLAGAATADTYIDEIRVYNRALSPAEVSKLYTSATGPIAQYKMDENTGSANAYDSSGYGAAATLNEFGSNIWTQGKFGSGINFSGTDNWVDLYSSTLNSNFSGTQGTVSTWFKVASASTWTDGLTHVILKLGPNSSNSITIQKNSTNEMELTYSAGGTTEAYYLNSSTTDWVHIAMSWDKSKDQVRYYINGILVDTHGTLGTWSGSLSSTRTTLGNNYNGTSAWNGIIDDLKIYNYPRSDGQIVEDMNGGHPSPGSPIGSATAYWKFDEGYGTTANDNSINDNDLTFSAAGWTNSGKFGKAYDGASNRRLTRSDDSDFDFTTGSDDFTISLWFNRGGVTSAQEYLIDKHATNDGFTIYMDSDGDIVCGIGDGTSFPEDTAGTTNANYDDTSWHHAVCVKQGTTSLTLYIDGKQVAQDTSITADGDMSNSGKLIIGDTNETDDTDEWLGDIDEIKIYRLAMSAAQVLVEFNQGSMTSLGALSTDANNNPSKSANDEYCPPGQGSTCTPPILHWKLDENTGTSTTNDISGNGYAGTLNGSMTESDWVNGQYGSALDFDGTDDRVQNTSISLPTGDFTYSAWIYPKALGTSNVIMAAPQATIGGLELAIDTDTDGDIDVILDNTTLLLNGTNGLISVNNWYHIAVTRSGSTVTSYINGKPDVTGTDADALSLASCGINVGSRQSSTTCSAALGDYFNGIIDDVRIYNYARTAAQVAWDANKGNPTHFYKMDESSWTNDCSTNTVFDSSGNAKHGIACPSSTGPTGGVTGKVNNAGEFDGSNDYVRVASPALPKKEITVAAWVYIDTSNNDRTILKGSNSAAGNELKMSIVSDQDGTNPRSLRFALDGTSIYSSTDIFTGGWYHVVGRRSGSTMNMWINGVQDSVSGSDSTDLDFSTCALHIGASFGGTCASPSSPTEYFDGKIDDLRIYSYALNETQIKNLYNEGAAIRFKQ